jgi:type I restriction enzyme M protein
MIAKLVSAKGYGEVLADGITLKNDKTYQAIVKRLASVSFYDSSFDSKGAAFEYYVRATLKGKKLGQYFTPRAVVRLMSALIGRDKIVNASLMSDGIRVVDPACGTGGFLVFLMKDALGRLQKRLDDGEITKAQYKSAVTRVQKSTFYGADANDSVASAAKMNMIIAGDGQSNIHPEDTLSAKSKLWSVTSPDCDVVMRNPPFGTSEADSLSATDMTQFPISTKKGQLLFIQKMVLCAKPDEGDICTVIDDGVLNTDTASEIRRWLFEHCRIVAVVSLPPVTFKPNKINVQSSVLYLRRRSAVDYDLESDYDVKFIEVKSLGYTGAGDSIRGFDEDALVNEIGHYANKGTAAVTKGSWRGFLVNSKTLVGNSKFRLDLRYWNAEVVEGVDALEGAGHKRLSEMVTQPVRRGKSPSAEAYVDEADGYALVVKAGSNISRFGEVLVRGDFLEKNQVEGNEATARIRRGDVLLSSTGTGTLGKCAVYREELPAVADGHVSIIRLDETLYDPEYVCDYLRLGFGAAQVQRLYTGSTGLIEITPDQVASIVIELPGDLAKQKQVSSNWRKIEDKYRHAIDVAESEFEESRKTFLSISQTASILLSESLGKEVEDGEW